MEYRNELKFLVSDMQLEIIRHRLLAVMKYDIHQKDGTPYTIRSLYFDDLSDTGLCENEAGVDDRSKYRIRIYDGDTKVIKLEKKSKKRSMTRKISASISYEDCMTYMEGRIPSITAESVTLMKELYAKSKMCGMMPKSIVEYERVAFVEPRGNVRITFDRNITGCSRVQSFFEQKIKGVPVLEAEQHILEVKYDEFLPEYIAQLLEIGTLRQTSFSKYYYSRIS